MTMSPPGWYDDGQHPGSLRWWNGMAWTEHYQPVVASPPTPLLSEPALQQGLAQAYPELYGTTAKKPAWPWALAAGCVAFLVIVGVVAWLLITTVFDVTAGPRQAIATFDRAWDQGDCELLRSVTTEAYQTNENFDGDICQWLITDTPAYEIDVLSVSVAGDSAIATTRERWTDTDGSFDEAYQYRFVRTAGAWRIDAYEPMDGDVSPIGS